MRSFLVRTIILLASFLLTATWFPQSMLPLWTMLIAANFFSLREGVICLAVFSLLGVMLDYPLLYFVILGTSMAIVTVFKMTMPNHKISIPQFIVLCVLLSIGAQLATTYHWLSSFIFTTFKHLLLILFIILPAKILGEAYQRYFNALGRNYE